MKECIICNELKSEFPVRSNGNLRGECKDCTASIAREYRKNNAQKIRLQAASNTYNITIDEAKRLYSKNKCSICGTTPKTQKGLCIDHCHDTGNVRDVLCVSCNFALGYFKDSIDTMEIAIDYLKKHKKC